MGKDVVTKPSYGYGIEILFEKIRKARTPEVGNEFESINSTEPPIRDTLVDCENSRIRFELISQFNPGKVN